MMRAAAGHADAGNADAPGPDAGALARAMAPRFDGLLRARLTTDAALDAAVALTAVLVDRIARDPTLRRVADLVRVSGLRERTLHRRFGRHVGVSPAWVLRRYRVHAAVARLTASPAADPRDVAWDLGYADQAHLVREFGAVVGTTPGAYARARPSG
jgi:AraC-like DNA-binding protein